jgi:hypothetical protein
MTRWSLATAALALTLAAGPATAGGITGQYIEARTCDVYTGPCFANADTGLTGKHAVMAWKIDRGAKLDGLGVVAVVAARETLGLQQSLPGKAVLIVDERATSTQRDALIAFAKEQGGDLLANVIDVKSAAIDFDVCDCKQNSCARLKVGDLVKVETRCLDLDHDKGCGNESNFYPPLAKGVKARAAVAVENTFKGKAFGETWTDAERRGAYVGAFGN